MLAETLGLPFHIHGASAMPHEILGYKDAGGTYHRTPFREAFEFGGVLMLDEVDAWDNGVLNYPMWVRWASSTTVGFGYMTSNRYQEIFAPGPFTWATGDALTASFTYECV